MVTSPLFQTIRNVGRLSHIVNVLARHGFKKELQNTEFGDFISEAASSSDGRDLGLAKENLSRVQRLAFAFAELGTTFIKLGQYLATREDLLPAEVIKEFRRLQDYAKPISQEEIRRILEKEYGGDLKVFFEKIEFSPLGAASISQVQKAWLKDGTAVVLKIRRPEIEHQIETDLSILKVLGGVLESAFPELRIVKTSVIIEELRRSLCQELDFNREASNTERMRQCFLEDEHIYVPQVYRSLCRKNVLCLEFIDGIKLTKIDSEDQAQRVSNSSLVYHGVRAFLDMTFKHGTFHGDLHLGNFIFAKNGKLAILDFGLTVRLRRELRETMLLMFFALIQEDLDSFSQLFMELTEPLGEYQRRSLEYIVLDSAQEILNRPLGHLNIGNLFMKIARECALQGAPVARELILFFRALIALEGFGKQLDPEFEILKEAMRYAEALPRPSMTQDWFAKDSLLFTHHARALWRALPLAARTVAERVSAGNLVFKIQSSELNRLGRDVDRAARRLSNSILMASVILGFSLLAYGKGLEGLFSLRFFGAAASVLFIFCIILAFLNFGRSGRIK